MPRLVTRRSITAEDRQRIGVLLDAAEQAGGRPPLDDHLRLDLATGGHDGFMAIEALEADEGAPPIAYAQLSKGNDAWELGVVVDPARREKFVELADALVAEAAARVRDQGGGRLHWWVHDASAVEGVVAEHAGMRLTRELHQMRRPLPTGLPVEIDTRAFVVGQDEAAWVAVNNRAFAGHPEQGGWDVDALRARETEPWFDADGFRLYEENGQLLGFCWTKIHYGEDPALGEIYVIGVDPAGFGRGLGRPLTLAGLDWLSSRGIGVGMLYVDAANTKATKLYTSLGFTIHEVTNAYVLDT